MITRLLRLATAGLLVGALLCNAHAGSEPGLALTFMSTGGNTAKSDTIVAPNVWLHVAKGETPSPFLAPGAFTATWRGFLSVELRSSYTFQAEVNGALKVVVNAQDALEVSGTGAPSEAGPNVRLNKGPNELIVTYTPAASGDPHVRLFWTAKGSYAQPIPQAALSHGVDEPLKGALLRHRGRALFIEHRCARCHATEGKAIPEVLMNAPVFAGIGSRRNPAWIREWLANPAAARGDARMPVMFHAGDAIDSAEAAAAFLASLTDAGWPARAESSDAAEIAEGERLFGSLHCAACHNAPGEARRATDKISLEQVAKKFSPGALARFLGDPAEHYGSIRMPDFHLTDAEAGQLASFLIARAAPAGGEAPRPELVPKGRELVQSTGCLNCHLLELENQFKTKRLIELANWEAGCLASQPLTGTRVPYYKFSEADRQAIREFAAGGFDSLTRHVDREFAARQIVNLNCAGCHGRQIDQVPPLEGLGGKLKPEYGAKIIAGLIPDKPRPWLAARMPGFATRAGGLAKGLANLHGFPAQTPPESEPVDEELAQIGFRLVQTDGGFSCIACHAIGKAAAAPGSESAGINFAWTVERLQHDYFVRWLRNPLGVDPSTKMPAFLDASGRSPLRTVLDGDSEQQIEALWQYFRGGQAMRAPAGMGTSAPKVDGAQSK